MRFFIAPALLVLAACSTVTPETQGQVTAFNGDTVTVRGGFTVGDGKPAEPTPAMIAQAKEVCPGATYLSATPDPDSFDFFLYLFKC